MKRKDVENKTTCLYILEFLQGYKFGISTQFKNRAHCHYLNTGRLQKPIIHLRYDYKTFSHAELIEAMFVREFVEHRMPFNTEWLFKTVTVLELLTFFNLVNDLLSYEQVNKFHRVKVLAKTKKRYHALIYAWVKKEIGKQVNSEI